MHNVEKYVLFVESCVLISIFLFWFKSMNKEDGLLCFQRQMGLDYNGAFHL